MNPTLNKLIHTAVISLFSLTYIFYGVRMFTLSSAVCNLANTQISVVKSEYIMNTFK